MLADGGEKGRVEQGSRQWPSPVPASGPWRAPGSRWNVSRRASLFPWPQTRITGEAAVDPGGVFGEGAAGIHRNPWDLSALQVARPDLGGRGLVEPFPVRACRELGAKLVIGVDVGPRPVPGAPSAETSGTSWKRGCGRWRSARGSRPRCWSSRSLNSSPGPGISWCGRDFRGSRGAISTRIRVP